MNKEQDFRHITAETAGKDLLAALVQEIRLLPNVWPKLSREKQDDVIDHLRNRVQQNVNMVVHVLASKNRTTVAGNLDKVTIKGNVEAVIKFGINAGNLPELFAAAADQESKTVLVVVADPSAHIAGMDEIRGEDDQRAMDLGHEYQENDGGGMDDKDIEDAQEVKELPEKIIAQEDLDKAYNDGWTAAKEGKPQSDCPILDSEFVDKWVRGFKDWHEQDNSNDKDAA